MTFTKLSEQLLAGMMRSLHVTTPLSKAEGLQLHLPLGNEKGNSGRLTSGRENSNLLPLLNLHSHTGSTASSLLSYKLTAFLLVLESSSRFIVSVGVQSSGSSHLQNRRELFGEASWLLC